MRVGKILTLAILITSATGVIAQAESLFNAGVSQTSYIVPRSLYGSVRAKSVGDIVTIIIEESIKAKDETTLDTSKDSSTTDNFSTLLNSLLPGKVVNNNLGSFGGTNTVSNSASSARTTTYTDYISAQVVQIMPNGNLLVQGKKTTINAGERADILVSGIIDPRLLDNQGKISSKNVANLQYAVTGKGTVSRSNSDGTVNKLIRQLF